MKIKSGMLNIYGRFHNKLVGCEKRRVKDSFQDFCPEQLKGGIFLSEMEKEMDRAGFGGQLRSSLKDIL